jgi:serine/threonine-protein kinase
VSDTNLVGQNVQNADGKTPVSYTLQELLTSNGVLDTYLAAHNAVNLRVSLKVLNPALTTSPDFATTFRDTIQALLKFNSPNLIKLYDYGFSGEFHYIAVEYHRSPTLRVHLDSERRLTLAQTVDYGAIVADALAYAAGQGISHGILSPSSVTLSSKRGPLLGDLGIGSLIGATLPRALASDPTLGIYAAPEVLRGATPDAQSDQYSLTAMIYEMAVGRPPFAGDMQAVINQHISTPPPDPAAADPALAGLSPVIARGMAKLPADRYPTLTAFITALLAAPNVSVNAAPVEAELSNAPIEEAHPDRTMPEMSVEELRRAAGVPTPASVPTPAEPSPAASIPEPASTAAEMSFDRTMPEVSVEELRRAAGVPTPASIPTPAEPFPAASIPEPAPAEMSFDRTMPEVSVEELRRAAGIPTPASVPTPKPAEANFDRTMPEVSVEELRRAAGVPPPRTAPQPPPSSTPRYDSDRTMPEVSVDELRRAAGVPTPASIPTPKGTPPKPMSVPYNFSSNPGVAQRHQTDERYRTGPIDDAPGAPSEVPMQSYPPAPYNPQAQRSVPYNFNSAPPMPAGGQATIPHDLDDQYETGRMHRRDLEGPEPGSGITAMISRVPASALPKESTPRRISPILIVLVILILLIVAAAIGFVMLHVLGILK